MSLPQRQIKIAPQSTPVAPKVNRRTKAEFDSHMAMLRFLVEESDNRETDEYLFRQLMQQCKILAKRNEFRVE